MLDCSVDLSEPACFKKRLQHNPGTKLNTYKMFLLMHHITYSIISSYNVFRRLKQAPSHLQRQKAVWISSLRSNPPVVYSPAAVLIHQLHRSLLRRVEQMEEGRWYFSPQVTFPQPRWAKGRLGICSEIKLSEWLNADRRTVKTKAASLYSQKCIKTLQDSDSNGILATIFKRKQYAYWIFCMHEIIRSST